MPLLHTPSEFCIPLWLKVYWCGNFGCRLCRYFSVAGATAFFVFGIFFVHFLSRASLVYLNSISTLCRATIVLAPVLHLITKLKTLAHFFVDPYSSITLASSIFQIYVITIVLLPTNTCFLYLYKFPYLVPCSVLKRAGHLRELYMLLKDITCILLKDNTCILLHMSSVTCTCEGLIE